MSKNPKMTLCRNCNTPISKKARICPSCGAKNKKPFFKRGWFILLILLLLMYGVSTVKRMQKEKFVWDDLELAERLPKPESNIGMVHNDSNDYLNLEVKKISEKQYKDYILECQKLKYTIEEKKQDGQYHAFHEDGYELSLSYHEDEKLKIELRAPMQMEALSWPKSEIAGLLPTPESSIGKVSKDTSDGCLIYVGETSIEEFNSYVDQCADKGFTIDYERESEFYEAKDKDGNRVSVGYQGNQVIAIEILKSEAKEAEPIETESKMSETDETIETESEMTEKETLAETEVNETEENTADEVPSNEIRPEFKEAMDSYEAFITEYCDFMKRYEETDGTDLGILADYAKYASQYADMVADFEAWENDEMNAAELTYYIEVQARVSKKLVEFAIE